MENVVPCAETSREREKEKPDPSGYLKTIHDDEDDVNYTYVTIFPLE